MKEIDLQKRTKNFALRIIRLVNSLPNNQVAWTLGKQLLRSGTPIGANYREAAKASSKKHFCSILSISSRKANETLYWLELLSESETVKPELLTDIMSVCSELIATFTASVKTAQQTHKRINFNNQHLTFKLR